MAKIERYNISIAESGNGPWYTLKRAKNAKGQTLPFGVHSLPQPEVFVVKVKNEHPGTPCSIKAAKQTFINATRPIRPPTRVIGTHNNGEYRNLGGYLRLDQSPVCTTDGIDGSGTCGSPTAGVMLYKANEKRSGHGTREGYQGGDMWMPYDLTVGAPGLQVETIDNVAMRPGDTVSWIPGDGSPSPGLQVCASVSQIQWNITKGKEFCHLSGNGNCVTNIRAGRGSYNSGEFCVIEPVRELNASVNIYDVKGPSFGSR